MSELVIENLGALILAVGALGTASFGVVEGLKWTRMGTAGFNQIWKILDGPIMEALAVAYGGDFKSLLREQYRSGRSTGELPTSLRQGVRIGLTPETARKLALRVGVIDATQLKAVAEDLFKGKELDQDGRSVLGRYELAVDALIAASLARANAKYVGCVRVFASAISVLIALTVGFLLAFDEGRDWAFVCISIFVGVAAVPVAPVAKDLSTAVRSAAVAISKSRS